LRQQAYDFRLVLAAQNSEKIWPWHNASRTEFAAINIEFNAVIKRPFQHSMDGHISPSQLSSNSACGAGGQANSSEADRRRRAPNHPETLLPT
jgi:hypothetical protein